MRQCAVIVCILFCLPVKVVSADTAGSRDAIVNNLSSSQTPSSGAVQSEPARPAAHHAQGAFSLSDNLSYDMIAHLVAGMRLPESSGYYTHTAKSAWKKYAVTADSRWASFNKGKAAAIKKWRRSALAGVATGFRTVLYPFSGPDFLYAYTFFPDADAYILIGLEPVGRPPNFSAMAEEDFSTCYQLLDESVKDVLEISFFKTNDMSEELSGECVTGTLPIMMLFLARTGNHITAIRFFDLDSNGLQVYRLSSGECRGKKGVCRGVEIEFMPAGSSTKKQLVYLSADISDNGFTRCPSCKAYLDTLEGPVVSFVKSASYLMHKGYFSGIRKLLLEKSAVILQDDSGIPYRYFQSGTWDITLYGMYTGPIEMFKGHFEKDLAAAYGKGSEKLNFRFGYARSSNILLAKKKAY